MLLFEIVKIQITVEFCFSLIHNRKKTPKTQLVKRFAKKWLVLWIVIILLSAGWYWRYEVAEKIRSILGIELPNDPRPAGVTDLEWCETNYSEEIAQLSDEFDVPYDYLMALIVLECGGNKPAGNRYEKGVFKQLQRVRDGKQKKFENIKKEHLAELDDEGLKNLATSWGPFQLMGYKVIGLGVNVVDIREEDDAAYYGVKWIKNEYGKFLEKKKWKDAFHYHNTGDRFPLSGHSHTHDPYYVSDGIKYMKHFAKKKPANAY